MTWFGDPEYLGTAIWDAGIITVLIVVIRVRHWLRHHHVSHRKLRAACPGRPATGSNAPCTRRSRVLKPLNSGPKPRPGSEAPPCPHPARRLTPAPGESGLPGAGLTQPVAVGESPDSTATGPQLPTRAQPVRESTPGPDTGVLVDVTAPDGGVHRALTRA